MSAKKEKQIQQAEVLLLMELIFNLYNQINFKPKLFRKKYGISKWKYKEAIKALKDMGLIEVEERKKPILKRELKEKIINAASSSFNTSNKQTIN